MRPRLRNKPCIFLLAFVDEIQEIAGVAIIRNGTRATVLAIDPARGQYSATSLPLDLHEWSRDRSVMVGFDAASNSDRTDPCRSAFALSTIRATISS